MSFEQHLKNQRPSREDLLLALKTYDGEDRVVPVEDIEATIGEDTTKKYATGFSLIDMNHEGGFEEGELVVVTGLTGQGKTTWLMSLTQNMQEHKAVWFTLEVTPRQFIAKLKHRNPQLPVFYMPKRTASHDVRWLEERILEAVSKYEAKVVFIDHLHRIISENDGDENNSMRIGRILNFLKDIAVDNNLVVFLVAHCRDLQKNEELHISHIRDSGLISREADTVIGIYRTKNGAELHEPPTREMLEPHDNLSKVLILKNRRTGIQGAGFLVHRDHYLSDPTEADILF